MSHYRQIVEEKYQENHLRMQENKSKNFHKVSVDVLKVLCANRILLFPQVWYIITLYNTTVVINRPHLYLFLCFLWKFLFTLYIANHRNNKTLRYTPFLCSFQYVNFLSEHIFKQVRMEDPISQVEKIQSGSLNENLELLGNLSELPDKMSMFLPENHGECTCVP